MTLCHLSTSQRKTVTLPPYHPGRITQHLPHHPNHHPPTFPTPVHHPLLQLGHGHPPSHPSLTHQTPHPLHDGARYHPARDRYCRGRRDIDSRGGGYSAGEEEVNLLLCTFLLRNVAVNTLLGIMMAGITNGTIGFLTSTRFVRVCIL